MARSAPGVGKKAAPKRSQADDSSLPSAEPCIIALDLAPLLTPYKRHRRISVRIERLHHQARLSKGRNNGDNSWSLASDELEDLFYEPPEGLTEPHTLSIRIVDIGAGATLAVLEYPVSPEPPEAEPEKPEYHAIAAAADEPSRRREKLAVVPDRPSGSAASLAGRTEASDEEDAYAALNAGLLGRKQAGSALPAADLRPDDDSPSQPGSSPLLVRKGEARPSLVAPMSTDHGAPHEIGEGSDHALEVAFYRLREEHAATKAELVQREAALSKAVAAAERVRAQARRDAEEALASSEAAWRADEAARLAAAEEHWRETSTRALLELRRLTGELADTQTALVDRQAEVAQLRQDAAGARATWQREMQSSLLQAESVWKAAESARLAAAENQWQEKVRRLEAELRAQVDAARSLDDGGLRRLGEENAILKATLADREATLEKMLEVQEQSRESLQREVHGSLLLAERAWKADEANRFAAAEAKWRKQSARSLAEAIARYEAAETALAQVRLEHSTPGGGNHNEESSRLHKDLETLRVALVDREEELARARAAADRTNTVSPMGSEIVLRTNRTWSEADQAQDEPRRPFLGSALSYVIGGAIVLLIIAAVLFYPKALPVLSQNTPVTRAVSSAVAALPVTPPAPVTTPVAPAKTPAATASAPKQSLKKTAVSQGVNLRGGPSTTDPVIVTLPRGTEVDIVEARGNWALIRVAGNAGAPETQGWVFSSFLNDPVLPAN